MTQTQTISAFSMRRIAFAFPAAIVLLTASTARSFLHSPAFTYAGRHGSLMTVTRRVQQLYLSNNSDGDKWNDKHVANNLSQVHEETNGQFKDSEKAAARDARDLSDPGMEAAAEARAVILANELIHEMKQKKSKEDGSAGTSWNDEHVAQNLSEVHEETNDQFKASEKAAARDAQDLSDPGMEAAAEARAVILAIEMIHEMKQKSKESDNTSTSWNDGHVAQSAVDVHTESADEMRESEDAAAWDAHDLSDAGMEAAAEERAVVFAAEMIENLKQKRAKEAKAKGNSNIK